MRTRKQNGKNSSKYRWISALILVISLAICLMIAYIYQKKLSDFSGIITIEAVEGGFPTESIAAIRQEQEAKKTTESESTGKQRNGSGQADSFNFTAWTERKDQPVNAEFSGRQTKADCYLLSGDSYLVLPWGKNLPADDTEGCVIGEAVAQEIFGGTEVEGQTLLCQDRVLTVRGVVQEPDNILLCQISGQSGAGTYTASGDKGAGGGNAQNDTMTAGGKDSDNVVQFDRINVLSTEKSGTSSQAAEQFISRYGLSAEILHFERRQNLNWLVELIPGKWSNFSGWSANLKALRADQNKLKQCEKSGIESLYLGWVWKRDVFMVILTFIFIMLYGFHRLFGRRRGSCIQKCLQI